MTDAPDPGAVPPADAERARHELDLSEAIADGVGAPEDGPARGVAALTADEFSPLEAIGGVRGLAEAVAPGGVFVVVYAITRDLTPSLVAALALAAAAVIARLVARTPIMHALGGIIGVAIGVVWAWRTGQAKDYYAWGLWTNAAYLVGLLATVAMRWPAVGVVVELLRTGFTDGVLSSRKDEADDSQAGADADEATADDSRAGADADEATADDPYAAGGPEAREEPADEPPFDWRALWAWRSDRTLVRRYTQATWLWIAMFALRLAVQLPLYENGTVGWLGTARLVMGVPLWALVLWGTWVLVRHPKVTRPDR